MSGDHGFDGVKSVRHFGLIDIFDERVGENILARHPSRLAILIVQSDGKRMVEFVNTPGETGIAQSRLQMREAATRALR